MLAGACSRRDIHSVPMHPCRTSLLLTVSRSSLAAQRPQGVDAEVAEVRVLREPLVRLPLPLAPPAMRVPGTLVPLPARLPPSLCRLPRQRLSRSLFLTCLPMSTRLRSGFVHQHLKIGCY